LAGKDIHWLKIDVEGFEEKVLKGWDSQILRPWIIVVEATIPNSPDTDFANWDPILTAAEYQFVYFDGLNRFYVSKEHVELAKAFSCPPNFFDDVVLSASSSLCRELVTLHQAREKELVIQAENVAAELNAANEHTTSLVSHAQWLEIEWGEAKQRIESLSYKAGALEATLKAEREQKLQRENELINAQQELERLQNHARWLQTEWDAAKAKIDESNQSSHHWWTVADQLNQELQSVYASKSWRMTWPLRKTMQGIKCLLALSMRAVQKALRLPKHIVKSLTVWAMRKVLSNPHLKSRASDVFVKHPRLKQQLRQLATGSGLITSWEAAWPTSQEFKPGSELEKTVALAYSPNMPEESIKNLSPRAARIYADLKRACEASKS
jgi:hypothetical protein